METAEVGRFQLWEYLVSHRQLLLRRPASASAPSNIDLLFGGVHYVSLPSTIRNPRVRSATTVELRSVREVMGKEPSPHDVHIIEGEGSKGFVVAGSARRVVNELELFESGLERFADSRSSAERLEREVLLALADFNPELEPALPGKPSEQRRRLDAVIRLDGRVVGLDVKWVSPEKARASIRNRVIEAVERLDPWLDHLTALLVVVGTHDGAAVRQAKDHLTTAVGSHVKVDVTGWVAGDPPELLMNAVRQLAA